MARFSYVNHDDLSYLSNHIFLPPKLPQKDDIKQLHVVALSRLAGDIAKEYRDRLDATKRRCWDPIVRMLERMYRFTDLPNLERLKEDFALMVVDDILALYVRAQNAAIIVRKYSEKTVFEIFEVSPAAAMVMGTEGKLICSYPGPAVEIANDVFNDGGFQEELASFIVQMDVDNLDSAPTTTKAGSKVVEERDTQDPRYISQLLVGILRGMGQGATVRRISKMIADDVLWKDAYKPWRRSGLWLIIRVAIQTSLEDINDYKSFILFFHSRLLHLCLGFDFSSDLIFCMRAKTSRRAYKLGSAAPDFVLKEVQATGGAAEAILQGRWTAIQRAQEHSSFWAHETLDVVNDTVLSLRNSREYLSQALNPDPHRMASTEFKPSQAPRLRGLSDFRPLEGTGLLKMLNDDPYVALADFEEFVDIHLDAWLSRNIDHASTGTTLASCLTQYFEFAMQHYSSSPEDLSLMILTIMELWVAIDKIAMVHCPLLREYSPEIPTTFIEPLLLRHSRPLRRSAAVETYLRSRHKRVTVNQSIFSDKVDRKTFSVRFFAQSLDLQSLKAQIENHATEQRKKKREELALHNALHTQRTTTASSMSHTYTVNNTHRPKKCPKCKLEKLAKAMTIAVHEWPLPDTELLAEAVTFELDCPDIFQFWRSSTFRILRDLGLSNRVTGASPHVILGMYPGLTQWANRSVRITLASSTKSFSQSHYKTTSIPASESSICVNNGLQFRLYDQSRGAWAAGPFSDSNISQYCTLKLPLEGPYQGLQYAVEGTVHTTNKVLADQTNCPKALSLHEHIAFASLRSGPLLQWMNIAREIVSNSLNFNREEVHSLLTQAAWQIGPLSQDGERRGWHEDLANKEFGLVLLNGLESLLTSIESNWLGGVTARTIIFLANRLLASASDPDIHQKSYMLLRRARAITAQWTRQLASKLQDSREENEVLELQLSTCAMAATCRATFHVDPHHLRYLLESADDTAIALECAIIIHDNTPLALQAAPPDLLKLLYRDRRLSHYLERFLTQRVRQDRRGMDNAILSLWTAYIPGSTDWLKLSTPNSRWLETQTTTKYASNTPQTVHLNLLEGRLLVDGKPLGRLPRGIVQHPTYIRIFGQKILDVVPSDMPGMEYASRASVFEHQVYFVLHASENRLVIRAKRENSEDILELIPHTRLFGDLPTLLVEGHAHWFNLRTGDLELRPLDSLWTSSPTNWHIRFSTDSSTMIYGESSVLLVDMYSPTFDMVSKRLQPLESAKFLTITYEMNTNSLSVRLPRLGLSFSLTSEGELESQNLPGMIIDNNQSCGTMFGLQNILVLREQGSNPDRISQSRRVLIPQGEINVAFQGNHPVITIDTGTSNHVLYHQYKVDSHLGYLAGNVNLASKLFKIYLHAISSHCLPDPLTGRTGTEESLQELCSSGCLSFQRFSSVEANLLELISSLTPSRSFYPRHLKVMQTVNWSNLPSLSQHRGFHSAAHLISDYAEKLHIFQTSNVAFAMSVSDDQRHGFLQDRAAQRSLCYYSADSSTRFTSFISNDSYYPSRSDIVATSGTKDESAVFSTSRMVVMWSFATSLKPYSSKLLSSLGSGSVASQSKNLLNLSYNRSWLRPNFADAWISLYNLCRKRTDCRRKQYKLAFSLPAMTYGSPLLREFVPILIAFATTPALCHIDPPSYASYDLSDEFKPSRAIVLKKIMSAALSLEDSPSAHLSAGWKEDPESLCRRRRSHHNSQVSSLAESLVNDLMEQWPCDDPQLPPGNGAYRSWFKISACMAGIRQLFHSCFKNRQLRLHIERVEEIILAGRTSPSAADVAVYTFSPCRQHQRVSPDAFVTIHGLLDRILAPDVEPLPSMFWGASQASGQPDNIAYPSNLQKLIAIFRSDRGDKLHQHYGRELENSLKDLRGQSSVDFPSSIPSATLQELLQYRDQCGRRVGVIFRMIFQSLSPSHSIPSERILHRAGLWPVITPRSILSMLAFPHRDKLNSRWKAAITTFAQAIIEYQRSQRLVHFALAMAVDAFYKESANTLFDQQNALYYPDWLLIQIEGDFLIRPIQALVAKEMMLPSSSKSTVLQLNMGEGKSSVIVPIVAAALADTGALVRVVVLKPLANQMFNLLLERLCGLVNRRVYCMPFSRDVKMGSHEVQLFSTLYEQCLREGGVLVVQPEHILSFKLMGVDCQLRSKAPDHRKLAPKVRQFQTWLSDVARDILDESDEILHVRYQLVYTIGGQRPLEDHPNRWTSIQQIFSLIQKYAYNLQQQFPGEVELVRNSSAASFPIIRILGDNAANALTSWIAEAVISRGFSTLTFALLPQTVREAALRFITEKSCQAQDDCMLRSYCRGVSWKGLLLLRGLLAHGIIIHVLKQKRWRVDYGLDPDRSMLAVPYRAKDTPSIRSEFGHPDVAVALTCLSYYYGGLTKAQLHQCFDLLFKLDNPTLEYEEWIHHDQDIPMALRQVDGINTQDGEQFRCFLLPLFHKNHAVIDFFLSQIVFPKEAKEFPQKMTTSGWDLVESKKYVTTGFSGTNDSRYLLPISIAQRDPTGQLSTNARVLMHLLRPENGHYICTEGDSGRMSTRGFLERLVVEDRDIRVLLDVGAQMLELQNDELAKNWLSLRPDVPAAIFFNDQDDLVVVTQDGSLESFISSPFNMQLDKCLVYLDDAHTRGTDLKLPSGSRAAVTLGPKVTKDRLIQGCMRMRKIGNGHSVMFCAPLEVDMRIRAVAGLGPTDRIRVRDILLWTMVETCDEIQRYIPHWTQQGLDHQDRMAANIRFSTSGDIETLRSAWCQPEARSLEEMYGFSPTDKSSEIYHITSKFPALRERLEFLGVSSISDTSMEEEQEREVSHELEREQQVQRPPVAMAATHRLHRDVVAFIKTGVIPNGSTEFCSLSQLLGITGSRVRPCLSQLMATRDFLTTIESSTRKSTLFELSEYLRPVNWIVSSTRSGAMVFVVLSPYEVQLLLPDIRRSTVVHLHQYTPRVTKAMKEFADLRFYCIPSLPDTWTPPPPVIRSMLNMVAGQLYLDSYEAYTQFCALLGVYTKKPVGESEIQSDGFIKPKDRRGMMLDVCLFEESPVMRMKELVGLRRKGMEYRTTHIGKILNARLLSKEDFAS